MKAEFNLSEQLVLIPESMAESMALNYWMEKKTTTNINNQRLVNHENILIHAYSDIDRAMKG